MTLIISCVTKDRVYQVSDRQLTSLDSGETVDDNANKAVLVGNMAFGYTGLAKIGTTRTDIWFASAAAEEAPRDALAMYSRVCGRATNAFKDMYHS